VIYVIWLRKVKIILFYCFCSKWEMEYSFPICLFWHFTHSDYVKVRILSFWELIKTNYEKPIKREHVTLLLFFFSFQFISLKKNIFLLIQFRHSVVLFFAFIRIRMSFSFVYVLIIICSHLPLPASKTSTNFFSNLLRLLLKVYFTIELLSSVTFFHVILFNTKKAPQYSFLNSYKTKIILLWKIRSARVLGHFV
jgi:uncharacterized protein YktA (UPF0223 family)